MDVACEVPRVDAALSSLYAEFEVPDWPDGFTPVTGSIRPYDAEQVLRHLSPQAQVVSQPNDPVEIYREGERFWLVDERWGLAEINLLRGTWRSWVIPEPSIDTGRLVEMAVLWPLAQLLRPKGLHLLPVPSVVRPTLNKSGDQDASGVLLLCPFPLDIDLCSLSGAGYRVVSARWTALREEEGRVSMLRWPTPGASSRWANVPLQYHAFCRTVMAIESGRRTRASWRPIDPDHVVPVLRQSWPIVDLHPAGRTGRLVSSLARSACCAQACLSTRPGDLLSVLTGVHRLQQAEARAAQTQRLTPPASSIRTKLYRPVSASRPSTAA
ncbi:MAG: hypothetical protein ACREIT_02300 [Tepidisphaeraceae bacterium]